MIFLDDNVRNGGKDKDDKDNGYDDDITELYFNPYILFLILILLLLSDEALTQLQRMFNLY